MPHPRIPPIILIFFMIDLALGIAYVSDFLACHPSEALTTFLDLDREGNLPTWYSSMQWFCVATLLGIFACYSFSLSQSRSWSLLILPLVFLALSLDEVAHIHELLGQKSDMLLPGASRKSSLFHRTGIWMFVIGLPFLGVLTALILSVRAYFCSPGALVKILLGMTLMLAGAIGLETLSNFTDPKSGYGVAQVFLEELCEMSGGTIVLWGSYELLRRHGFMLRFDKAQGDHSCHPATAFGGRSSTTRTHWTDSPR